MVKKFSLFAVGLALCFVLSACGEKTTGAPTETTTAEGENYDDPSIVTEEQEKELKKVKVTDEKSYSFIEPILEENAASAYAVITNNSEYDVDLSEITVTFKKKDGTVAYVAESGEIDVAPYILKPKQKAYMSVGVTLDIKPEEYGEADIKLAPTIAIDEVETLPTEKGTLEPGENKVYVKGIVKNDSKENVDVFFIGAGLYDAQGEFLATTFLHGDTPLSPKDKVGFESYTPDLPTEIVNKVKEYKVSASYYPEIPETE
jgi:hypothetical protein